MLQHEKRRKNMSKAGLIKTGAAFVRSLFKSAGKTKAILRSPAQRAGKRIKLENKEFRFDNNGKLKTVLTDHKDGSYSQHLYENGRFIGSRRQHTDLTIQKELYYKYKNDRLVETERFKFNDDGSDNITKKIFNYAPESSQLQSIDTFHYHSPNYSSKNLIYTTTQEIK